MRNTLQEIKDVNPQTFEEFLPLYLEAHSHPFNRLLHFLGTNGALVYCAVVMWTGPLWLLLFSPLVGYLPAWFGHFFVESNIPATYSKPLWSIRGDIEMYKMMVSQKSIMHFDPHQG